MPQLKQDLPPIISFDFNTFMEHGSMMSREHILLRLAKEQLVLHSTPPSGRHVKTPPGGFANLRNNLYHYSNPWYLPEIYRSHFLGNITGRLRSLHRCIIIKKLGAKQRPILYLWHPYFSDEIGRYNEQLVVYHIYDDYSTLPGSHEDWKKKEEIILQKADLVFVINEKLLEAKRKLVDREYHHLPQGVDFSVFEMARKTATEAPEDIGYISMPRIGYIGRVNAKVNLDLICWLAQARKDWSFIFIGPVDRGHELDPAINKLKSFNNVYFLGTKPFNEIPNYWIHLDVALVPYRTQEGQWAHFGSPLKLREAFAAGKPLVVSPLDDYGPISHLLRFADTGEDWLREIQFALDRDSNDPIFQEAITYAERNSWENRVVEIRALIEHHL